MIERTGTKEKILDTAEKLFGLNGFESVSLREITTGAGVNLAAVNYHFHSKDALIDAVIARRIEPVNIRRMAMLDALGPNPTVEQLLEAFLRPVFEIKLHPLVPWPPSVLWSNMHAPLARACDPAPSTASILYGLGRFYYTLNAVF